MADAIIRIGERVVYVTRRGGIGPTGPVSTTPGPAGPAGPQGVPGNATNYSTDVFGPVNLFNQAGIFDNNYNNAGGLVSNAGYFVTNYMAVVPGSQITFSHTLSGVASPFGFNWFDASKVYLPGAAGNGTSPTAGVPVTVPAGAYFLRTSVNKANNSKATLMVMSGSTVPSVYVPFGIVGLATANAKARDLADRRPADNLGFINLFDLNGVTNGKHLSGGIESPSGANAITNYIPVSPGGQFIANATSSAAAFGAQYYTEDLVYIPQASVQVVAGVPHPVPALGSPAYVRFTIPVSVDRSSFMVVRGATLPTYYLPFGLVGLATLLLPMAGTVGMHLGDSVTDNFPEWRNYIAARNYMTSTNNALAGRIMRDVIKDRAGVPLDAADFTGVDWAMILAGTNDFSQGRLLGAITDAASGTANSIYANTRFVIETLQALKPGVKSPFAAPLRLFFLTPLYRAAAPVTPPADSSTLRDHATAIKEVCSLYGVPCLDLYSESGVNALTANALLEDGLHPSALDKGITTIGKPVSAWLRSIR